MAGAAPLTTALDKLSTAVDRIVGFAARKYAVDVPAETIENGRVIQEVSDRLSAMADKLMQAIPADAVYADPTLLGAAPTADAASSAKAKSYGSSKSSSDS